MNPLPTTVNRWDATVDSIFSELDNSTRSNQKVDREELRRYYKTVTFDLINHKSIPYLLLVVQVALDPSKVRESKDIRIKLRELAFPSRLFLEKFSGFTKDTTSWSPHVSNLTWINILVSEEQIKLLKQQVLWLYEGKGNRNVLAREIQQSLPFTLEDKAFPITSHLYSVYNNLHVVTGQTSQPALGGFLTPFIMTLATEKALLDHSLQMYPGYFMSPFSASVNLDDLILPPMRGPGFLAWLSSLLVWTKHENLETEKLDREKGMILSNRDVLQPNLEEFLKRVSDIGSRTSTSIADVGSIERRFRDALKVFTQLGGSGFSKEVPIPLENAWMQVALSQSGATTATIASMANIIINNLERSKDSLRAIEDEIALYQHHLSDLVGIRAQEATIKQTVYIRRLTIALTIFTGALVGLTFILALPILGTLLSNAIELISSLG